jgi:hypothetical protein
MIFDKDMQIRRQMIKEGYAVKQIDGIHKEVGLSYGLIEEIGNNVRKWFFPKSDK